MLISLLMLLLLTPAARAADAVQLGLLICPDPQTCALDEDWVRNIGGGGPGGFESLDFEAVMTTGAVPDGIPDQTAYREALDTARSAGENGRWQRTLEASERGIEALSRWRGPVRTQELFDLWFLRGQAAAEIGRDASQQYAFRQAAAVANGSDLPQPATSQAVEHAWLDELRKLTLSGKGTLVLEGGPPGTQWMVDGRSVPAGALELWPGNHRVTATAPNRVQSWTVDVPVLSERSSSISPDFQTWTETAAVFGALQDAIAILDAPEPVKDLLVAWAVEHEVDEVRLMRVEQVSTTPTLPPVAITQPPRDRPVAAAGEAVDMGDGVPTTFEDEVMQRHRAPAEVHATRVNRLRVVFFDPDTRRFSTDPTVGTALRPPPERVRVGVRTSGLSMMNRWHLGLDLGVSVPLGPIEGEARVGLVRADSPYNLYEGWVDRQLYHAYLGARWAPAWQVAPFVAAGLDVFAPAAIGGRAAVGAQVRFAEEWRVELDIGADLLDRGLGYGGGLALSRGF